MMGYLNGIKMLYYQLKYKELKLDGKNQLPKNAFLQIRAGGRITLKGNVQLNRNTALMSSGGHIEIGENVSFNRNSIAVSKQRISIGKNTRIGPNVCIYDHDHNFDYENGVNINEFKCSSIEIGENCWIGANVVILKGVHIGNNCVIGAGVVLGEDVPAHTLVKGNRDIEKVKIR